MLSGTYLYYIGIIIALWSGWALLIFEEGEEVISRKTIERPIISRSATSTST